MNNKTTHMRGFIRDKAVIAKLMHDEKVKTFPGMIHKLLVNYKKKKR